MKIEKLPSGSYRIRKMYKGQTYTVITDYKPTQKEALKLMATVLDRVKPESQIQKHVTFHYPCTITIGLSVTAYIDPPSFSPRNTFCNL